MSLGSEVYTGFTIDLALTPGSATGGEDYVPITPTLSFAGTAGETQTFDVTIIDDSEGESEETLTVSIQPPSFDRLFTPFAPLVGEHASPSGQETILDLTNTSTVTIVDNELSFGGAIADQTWVVGVPVALTLPATTGGNGMPRYTLTGTLPNDVVATNDANSDTPTTLSGTPAAATAVALTYTVTDSDPSPVTPIALAFSATVRTARTDVTLSELSVTPIGGAVLTLALTFEIATTFTAFTAEAPFETTSVTVAATPNDGTVSGLTVGDNTLTVHVTAEDRTTTQDYTITLTVLDAPLMIGIAGAVPGTLDFGGSTHLQAFTLTPADASATFTAESANNLVTAEVTGAPPNRFLSITPVAIDPGIGTYTDTVTLTVSSAGRADATTDVSVALTPPASFTDASLSTLSVTPAGSTAVLTFTPVFDTPVFTYTATAPAGTTTVTVEAATDTTGASIQYAMGETPVAFGNSGTFTVSTGSNVLTARVTVGSTIRDYTITLTVLLPAATFGPTPSSIETDTLADTYNFGGASHSGDISVDPPDADVEVTIESLQGPGTTSGLLDATVVPKDGGPDGTWTITITPRGITADPGTQAVIYTETFRLTVRGANRDDGFRDFTLFVNPAPITLIGLPDTVTTPFNFGGTNQTQTFDFTLVPPGDDITFTTTVADAATNGLTAEVTGTGASISLTVTAPDSDNGAAGTYTITVTASAPAHRTAVSHVMTVTLATAPVVTLVLTPNTISEAGGVSTFTATLNHASAAATVVEVTATPSTGATTYNLSVNTTLTIAAGTTTSTGEVTLTAIDNNVDAPDKEVMIGATVQSGPEGVVAPPAVTLTFTTGNWSTAQTVTISSTEDDDAVDEATFTLTHDPSGTGSGYENVDSKNVTVTVEDNETAGITLTPNTVGLTEGTTATYTAVLDSEPTATVTLTINSNNSDVTVITPAAVAPALPTLTFTAGNWDTAQTVTINAAEDDGDSMNDMATLTHTADGGDYGSIAASTGVTPRDAVSATVDVTVIDNDAPT